MSPILILAIFVFFISYSLFGKAADRLSVTLPMVFAALGYATWLFFDQALEPPAVNASKSLLAEVTLVLVLFSDASRIRFSRLAANWRIPARMLLIGMPLTVALGSAVAYALTPGIGVALAMFIAALLTPTDAALGQSVVSNPEVPERLSQSINVESGLNDGLALPFVLVGAILASGATNHGAPGDVILEAAGEVILAPIVGALTGWALARTMNWARERDLATREAGAVIFLSAAFSAYLLSGLVGGNGFIAAYVAGMVFGNACRDDISAIGRFSEEEGQVLTMLSFLAFGAFLLPAGLAFITFETLLGAVLFLTLARMAPIYLSLWGTGLPPREKLFLGWFGPRGLASILFTLIMAEEFDLPHEDEIIAIVSLTVGLSILLHGLSADHLSRKIAGRPPG